MNLLDRGLAKCDEIRDAEGNVRTEPFLQACEELLPFLDTFGSAFFPMYKDVECNVTRLRSRMLEDPVRFELITSIALAERKQGTDTAMYSATRGLLWLVRGMIFTTQVAHTLGYDSATRLSDALSAAYAEALQPYHGWMATTAFRGFMLLAPSRDCVMERLGGDGSHVSNSLTEVSRIFGDVVHQLYSWMDTNGFNYQDVV